MLHSDEDVPSKLVVHLVSAARRGGGGAVHAEYNIALTVSDRIPPPSADSSVVIDTQLGGPHSATCDTILHKCLRDNSETSPQLPGLPEDTDNWGGNHKCRSKFGRVSLALRSVVQCPF
ncbi:hypothetical protein EYF80_016993 [Liparis tanakae]|uniref:Uncharacterized protein n=1 Tax=Liparis tanakae TaxID=230148 RepID=A0A4Z2I3Q8_9TELE|nr:hypothetical protein EYF80_016993 [Liparis tanakae]